jgi:hypothetical protein
MQRFITHGIQMAPLEPEKNHYNKLYFITRVGEKYFVSGDNNSFTLEEVLQRTPGIFPLTREIEFAQQGRLFNSQDGQVIWVPTGAIANGYVVVGKIEPKPS